MLCARRESARAHSRRARTPEGAAPSAAAAQSVPRWAWLIVAHGCRGRRCFAFQAAGYTGRRAMREMTVYGVSFDMVGRQPIVL